MSLNVTPTLLQLRGVFLLPELQEQGFKRRMGEGQLFHAIPITDEYLLIHTDASVSVRSVYTQEILWEIDCPSFSWACNIGHNLLALVLEDTTIILWDLRTGQIVQRFMYEVLGEVYRVNLHGLALSQDGNILAVSLKDHVVLWDVDTGRRLQVLPVPSGSMWTEIHLLAFHPSGTFVVGGSFYDNRIWFWSVHDGSLLTTWELLGDNNSDAHPYTLEFNHDGTFLFVALKQFGLGIWDCEHACPIIISTGDQSPSACVIDPLGRYVAVSQFDRQKSVVQLLKIEQWQVIYEWNVTRALPHFSLDGHFLTTTESVEGCVILREVETGQERGRIMLNRGMSKFLAFHPSGQLFVSGPIDGTTFFLCNSIDGSLLQRFTLPEGRHAGEAVALSSDCLFFIATENTPRKRVSFCLWHVADGATPTIVVDFTHYISCVVFHPNSRLFAFGSTDKTIRLWDAAQKQEMLCWGAHAAAVLCLAFAPHSFILASGSLDTTIRLWEAKSRHLLGELNGHEMGICVLAFSPNGQFLASGDEQGRLCVWDVAEQKQRCQVHLFDQNVSSLAWSPDGRFLISNSESDMVYLYDCENGCKIPLLKTYHKYAVNKVAFSPDGLTLLTSDGYCIRFWDAATMIDKALRVNIS